MKHPVYWFLISSSLFASNSLSFANDAQTALTPSDSYNGNVTSEEFQVKETSSGTTYTCEGNVCISFAGKDSGLKKSCFSATDNLTFLGNGYTLCFDNITTTASNPGAINVQGQGKTLGISGFSLFSCAYCPPGTTGYGAIQTKGNTTLKDNSSLVFHKNCSTAEGGAIQCKGSSDAELKIENNQNLVFSENSSTSKGGAIYADKLTIVSGGPTLFSNNSVSNGSSPKGGAISIKDSSGECSLTADLGDITFDGNKIIKTSGGSSTVTRNSIDLGTGKFTKLRAKDGFGIFFYDPITGGGSDELNINKKETVDYTGKIVFSGEKLSDEEKARAENLASTFNQPITLSAGSLVLKDGVSVTAKQVTQEAGSTVVMDLGTTLQTPSSGGETITLTNLDINIASLGGGGTSPAKLATNTASQAITINAVNLVDADGNAYEDPILATSKPFTAIVATTNASTVTQPTDNLTNYVPPTHYGYQGNWTVTWDTETATKTATLTWEQTGYSPNPERQGPLVPNTLWGAFSDLRAIQNLMDISVNGADYHRGFWVSGLANFLHKSGSDTKRKFRHNSAGYALGVYAKTPSDDIFSAAFCQLFGKDKDYLVSKNNANIYAGSLYYQHISYWSAWQNLLQNTIGAEAPLVLNAQLTYCHASNDMKTNMTTTYAPRKTTYAEIKGDWGNDCFGVELGATVPIQTESSLLFDMYSPFLKFQLVHTHQDDFKENNSDQGRYFESSNLTNLSLPIGIKFERFANNDTASYHVTAAYSPDIVRSNPDCTTSLLVSPDSAVWVTKANNLARSAFMLQAGNYLSLSHNIEIFSQFGFELRGSSRTYNVDLGSKIQF
ncbi:autotransporter domain-containing protein [Chlamydia abortus]|uniref:autotransporter domain-containing protein n=1 Tax=Chlamydia abortus TaxID=83555 RepID=UPI000A27C68C|nr:autotransporter domain-containing protein [Chlamydia abortus]ASD30733.1 Pmp family polymorphic membrane protein autotransporter adhesin [Chlamydia abortus]SFW08810.1 polymorphic outer membrane protein G family protein [Chlamydia abortus]SGA12570.1 polymorphic outer membrane protein G family protein [Chlamydia abortus]SGA13482.1 polymorphic outer membrane protein G family protein [Chlamydia abortus]SGW34780.1 polymorphic outer membrane protein G family protein [Chlamydia abortus]